MNIKKPLLLLAIICASLKVQAQAKDSIAVMQATQKFLKAFTGFDWNTFRHSFSADATIFYPAGEQKKRRAGKKEIEETWLAEFPEFIDSTKKFDLVIEPKDMLLQLYGHTAIVSFHMGGEGKYFSRRTIVFVKGKQGWKIVHLHASMLLQGKD